LRLLNNLNADCLISCPHFLFSHHNKDCWAAFDKIGGASEKKIEQALFFPLGLHYLCKNYLFMEKDEIQKLTYSEAVAELEKIVREMQSDACSIDNLSRLTSRSLELLKVCKAKLLSTDEELKKILAELEA
jgi:exodeoxyribonuclease VII small subunit